MLLVLVLQPAQDRDGVLDRRLGHEHGLEAPRERSVLLHMLAVFVERGRADAVQLAARQRRLQQVGGVHGAVGLACADQRVHLVDEQDDAAFGGGHLLQHGLQPLLELAAIFRAGNQRAHVEREQLLVLQAFRHVAVDDALGQALDDGGLADAGLADQHRIVLGPARQHLDGAADLLVAADHRIDLALARRLRQVARILLQRVIGVLGRGAVGGAALAQRVDRRVQVLRVDAALGQDFSGLGILVQRQRQQQPLDGDEAVAGLLGRLLGGIEQARGLRRQIDLPGARAGHLRQLAKRLLGRLQDRARIAARTVDQTAREPLRVVEQNFKDMQGVKLLMALAGRQRLRRLDEAARTLGVLFDIHNCPFPRPANPPRKHGKSHRHGVSAQGLDVSQARAGVAVLKRPGLGPMWERHTGF